MSKVIKVACSAAIVLLFVVMFSAGMIKRARAGKAASDSRPQRITEQCVGRIGYDGVMYLVSDNGTGTEYLVIKSNGGVAIERIVPE